VPIEVVKRSTCSSSSSSRFGPPYIM
jgi:hypothetical protein